MAKKGKSVLELQNARVSYRSRGAELVVIPGLSLEIAAGEAYGLVGESGCGKSTVAFAIMNYLGRGGRLTGGRIVFEGRDMATLDRRELRALRGDRLAMVYQNPMSSLNPVLPVGPQIMEVPLSHGGATRAEARRRTVAALEDVELRDAEAIMARYPHQLSGGQQQRVVIAMALVAEPKLLILDEPTTGLDVTVEAAVLDLISSLRARHRTAILFISHNLRAVARISDRIGVMYEGEIVEEGPAERLFSAPRHPYSRRLLASAPTLASDKRRARLVTIPGRVAGPGARPPGCAFAARCAHVVEACRGPEPVPLRKVGGGHRARCLRLDELGPWRPDGGESGRAARPTAGGDEAVLIVKGLTKQYRSRGPWAVENSEDSVRALDGVDLTARAGRTLAIVGESGSGKSTLAKVVAGLELASTGSVRVIGHEVARRRVERRPRHLVRGLQMVFQDPDSTLNPSHSVGFILRRALRRLAGVTRAAAGQAVGDQLERVHLPREYAARRPRALSGGEIQRVALARALIGDPALIIADEAVSALDVSVRAAILNLMADIEAERGPAMLFISHDLAAVRYIADEVAVMYGGRIVEFGPVAAVFAPPHHPYTELLLNAAGPATAAAAEADRDVVAPAGCPFAPRCPRHLGEICDRQRPPEQPVGHSHRLSCHISPTELGAALTNK